MAEKLRKKFIILSVGVVFAVLLVIAGFINISNYSQIVTHADELLNILEENNGNFPKENNSKDKYDLPPKMSPEAPFTTRFFIVKTDENNDPVAIDIGKISSATTTEAIDYAKQVLKKEKSSGFIKDYKYRIIQKDYGNMIVFVDCGRDLQMFHTFLYNSIEICLIGITAVFILVFIFSKKVIAPVAESYEKQKQFITDASHELKTPLAIISTNTEVLEMDYGESEWTRNIHNQIGRMSELISSLISLTRMDEEKNELLKTDFSLSDAISETAEPFKTIAKIDSKELIVKVEKNLSYCGNEQAIRQLISILLDNAIKYATDNSQMVLSLKRQGKKYILQSMNEAYNLNSQNYDILFERFYRADSSRNSKKGGYGIGLSVAKSIVMQHKGKITAESPDGKKLIITVQL
ncbi:sensor histidine kinase [Anaerovorax odorimutans]|uniref:sensor histidine kinase n=1 Tax=Anaerovorax odorimutans TaxID=109327 RepID=UPI00048052D2|nr:HAMP domain-containing sensor histidine kinase [Anaerovorax odorimutans]